LDFPEPLTPVKTMSRSLGRTRWGTRRLCSLASTISIASPGRRARVAMRSGLPWVEPLNKRSFARGAPNAQGGTLCVLDRRSILPFHRLGEAGSNRSIANGFQRPAFRRFPSEGRNAVQLD